MIGEVNILGLYMSPLLPCILVGVVLSRFVRAMLLKKNIYAKVWHAPLFDLCLTVICSGTLVYVYKLLGPFVS